MAHRLAFPPALIGIHNIFHVSQLRKYFDEDKLIPDVSEIELSPNLS